MILPISHERMSARRWPIVTTVIFLACFVVQCLLLQAERAKGPSENDGDDARARVVEYFAQHPYLDVRPGAIPELDTATIDAAHAAGAAIGAPDDETRRTEQRELDDLLAKATAVSPPPNEPFHRWGYVPAQRNWLGLLTYPFLHGGWLHLLGNMWFLFFAGMTLEDRWGRVVFPLFYVTCGAVAGLVHGALSPHDATPLVGASGAIAGCMGAFAVAFARTRVRFLSLLTLRPRTFSAPAYAVLPLWAAFEFLWAFVFRDDGTAHWAHVGGFVFGALAALALRRSGLDHRLDDAVERAATLGGDPRIDEARLLVSRGQAQLAIAMLEGLAQERPNSPHVQDALADAARAVGEDAREQKARQRAETLRKLAG